MAISVPSPQAAATKWVSRAQNATVDYKTAVQGAGRENRDTGKRLGWRHDTGSSWLPLLRIAGTVRTYGYSVEIGQQQKRQLYLGCSQRGTFRARRWRYLSQ